MRAVGLMSGTSADGVDAALIETDGVDIQSLGSGLFQSYPQDFRQKILDSFGQRPSSSTKELERELTLYHVNAVRTLLEQEKIEVADIDAIGFHGQTILHCPPQGNQTGETFQLGDGQLLANEIAVQVVCQFRQNDMAYGGQGAPLVPVFHQALTHSFSKPLCVVNIGGVSNVTWLGPGENQILAMDTGPGNALIDDWVRQHTTQNYDIDGKIAASGTPQKALVDYWLTHPYFKQRPPKSLDRDMFRGWCFENEIFQNLSLSDQVASLTAFTVRAFMHCRLYLPTVPQEWIICGGGASNPTLIRYIQQELSPVPIIMASQYGWSGAFLEAHAFGFLAVRSLKQLPITFPLTTGVQMPICGGVTYKPLGSSVCHVA